MSTNTEKKGYCRYTFLAKYLAKLDLSKPINFARLSSGIAIASTLFMGACTTDGKITIDCTIPNSKTFVNETVKVDTTADKQGTACDAARAQAKATQALPTAVVTDPTTPGVTVPSGTGKTIAAYGAGKKEMFKTAFVPGKTESAQLIATVDPQKRQEELSTRLISSGKARDPFEVIPGTVKAPFFPAPKPPKLTQIRPPKSPRTDLNGPVTVAPPVARTDEAAAVLVSGVIEVKGTAYAIVAAPGEPTTRYVTVGSRLSNNQILVKRIDSTGLGTVVLEQNGIEIARPIGKAAVIASAPGTAPNITPGTTVINPTSSVPVNTSGTNQALPPGFQPQVTQPGQPQSVQPGTQPINQPGATGNQGQRFVAPSNVPVPGLPFINNNQIQ
jgi:hypothetical protein